MTSNRTIALLTKLLLAVTVVFGVVTFSGVTAEAQYRHRGRVIVQPRVFVYPRTYYPRRYWGYNRVYFAPSTHVTEDQGFRDGLNDGRDDAKDRKSYDPSRHNSYKNAQTSAYLDGFRRGYEEGYSQRNG